MLPSIEDGRVVLRIGGELDGEGAAAVARLIGQSMGDFSIDFTDVKRVEESGFAVLAQAIRRCPYKLVVRGLLDDAGLPQDASSYR
jgi:ABC-type transporter Mla MlaB component